MEGALFRFQVELEFPQAFQDLRNMVTMFCQALGVNQDVIDVDQDEFVEKIAEHLMDEVLEDGGGVDQAIQHHDVLVVSSRCYEGCLPLVPLTYPEEVIRAAEVQLGEDGGTTEVFQSCWDERKWISKLDCDVVERSIVDTWPQASVLFLHKEARSRVRLIDGCSLEPEPPRCILPWPSPPGWKGDRSFPLALTHSEADQWHSPMASVEAAWRLS